MIRLLPQARRAMARYADAGVAPAGRRPRRHRSASAAR
jgi:hypothetical protein